MCWRAGSSRNHRVFREAIPKRKSALFPHFLPRSLQALPNLLLASGTRNRCSSQTFPAKNLPPRFLNPLANPTSSTPTHLPQWATIRSRRHQGRSTMTTIVTRQWATVTGLTAACRWASEVLLASVRIWDLLWVGSSVSCVFCEGFPFRTSLQLLPNCLPHFTPPPLRTLEWWDLALQKRLAWALFVCYPRVLSANSVDLGLFCFKNPPPPPKTGLGLFLCISHLIFI